MNKLVVDSWAWVLSGVIAGVSGILLGIVIVANRHGFSRGTGFNWFHRRWFGRNRFG